MAKYIDRDALLGKIEQVRWISKNSFPRQHFVVGDVMTCIRTAPDADVSPVRHGRWNDINPTVLNPGVNWICRCSLCGCPQDYKHNYCPNCGARMGKENEHEAG